MDTHAMFTLAITCMGALLGTLSIIVGWIGSRVIIKLDDLISRTGDNELKTQVRISNIENRVIRLEIMSTK